MNLELARLLVALTKSYPSWMVLDTLYTRYNSTPEVDKEFKRLKLKADQILASGISESDRKEILDGISRINEKDCEKVVKQIELILYPAKNKQAIISIINNL